VRGAESRHLAHVRAVWQAHAWAACGGGSALGPGPIHRNLPALPKDASGGQQVLRVLRRADDGTSAGDR
jgi:hypothetical protein